eukprot:CAMPEP_0172621872 /NCGR_PEP_ID=MMETSP1068-20121228/116171_1 /TAXON_ID=35684 /ORGANISM="Pseudopedinella elastica, Strain CCMP716" /LENGTH=41 /DNA_ID= /DNA_START= /DNA_END= /DNA_ORIENTATION=
MAASMAASPEAAGAAARPTELQDGQSPGTSNADYQDAELAD